MPVSVSSSRYQWAHGRKPRDRGDWAFSFDGSQEPFWVVDVYYSEAARHAARVAAERGVSSVEVMS